MPQDDNANERWLPVSGYEGLYEVSDHGRVRSLPRVYIRKNGVRVSLAGGVLYQSKVNGYRIVTLYAPGRKRRARRVHPLVLKAFVGPRPKPTAVWHGAHDNNDRSDNRLGNLSWKTRAQNREDKKRHDTWGSKLSRDDVLAIKRRLRQGDRKPAIAVSFCVSRTTICDIASGRTWSHLTA